MASAAAAFFDVKTRLLDIKKEIQRLSDEQGKLGTLLKTFVSKFEEQKKAFDKQQRGPKDE